MATDLSIIIVNWKSAAFTRECLTSIRQTAREFAHEVIVIDNASFDGCAEMVKNEFPEVKFIQSERNVGFALANNLAFEQSNGRNILYLNPDTEVAPGALARLLETLELVPGVGMVGARLLNSDGSLQTTCITSIPSILNQTLSSNYLRTRFPKWRIWGMRPLYESGNRAVPVEAISGACMMAKRDVVEKVGGFTTDYFMYSEDMDLCLKVANAGWKIYYVPSASITHHGGKSSSSRDESNFSSIMIHDSVERFMRVHRGSIYAALYRISTAGASVVRLFMLLGALPLALHRERRRFVFRAFSKWFDLLSWSIYGGARWVAQQQGQS